MKREPVQNQQRNDDGTYVVRTNRKMSLLAFILCIVIAFAIWIYVMNTENSNYTKTFSVPIEVLGEEELYEHENLSFYDISNTVTNITVQGTKADIRKYSEKDFHAYVDISGIREKGRSLVGITVESPSANIQVTVKDPASVTVYVEEEMERELAISGIECEDGCGKYDFFCAETTVLVRGPKEYVSKLGDEVTLIVPTGSTALSVGDTVETATVVLKDKQGQTVSNLYFNLSPKTFTVTVRDVHSHE